MTENMFEIDNPEVKLLVDIAMETEVVDPIDWGELNITEKEAYVMMASHVLEMEHDPMIDKAIITKLLVENFVLNLKLLGKK